MNIRRMVNGAIMAGIGLLSLVQTSAMEVEIIPNGGKMSKAEKKEAEQIKQNMYEVEVNAFEKGSKKNDRFTIVESKFPMSVFGRYGLSVSHWFVHPVSEGNGLSLFFPPKIVEMRIVPKEIFIDRKRDLYLSLFPEKCRNKIPLYSGTERLLRKEREVFWIGTEEGLPKKVLKYYSSKIADDNPYITMSAYPTEGKVDPDPKWAISGVGVRGNSGAVVYAKARGRERERQYSVPVGVITSSYSKEFLFRGIDNYLLEIEKYEAKKGEKNVEIIPLPDWIK